MVTVLAQNNSLVSNYLAEIRDDNIQKDSMRFRRNLERIGEVMAMEISKTMDFEPQMITTPLGEIECQMLSQQPVIATILRAGLPLHSGLLNYFDQAENCFISAFRKHTGGDDFEIEIEYLASPQLGDKTLILCDPMLASGASMVLAYKAVLERGVPEHLHVCCAIASEEGLKYAKRHLPAHTQFWIGDVDKELTAQAYIVPGLGDAGDLAYGSKM